jgi:hypothetical protein
LGAKVRDWKGNVVAAKSLTKSETLEPIAAKALVALHAAEFCKDLGFRDIIMKGNALQVVTAIKSIKQNWSRYGQLISDTQVILYKFYD